MSAITLMSSTAGRIGQLVRMLGSDQSGEVIAAASAIKRTLRAAGVDMHAFADAAELALTSPLVPADDDTVALIRLCLDREDDLNDRERQFIHDLDRLRRREIKPSPRQEAWLISIFERLRGVR
jgi:hypothetical protein